MDQETSELVAAVVRFFRNATRLHYAAIGVGLFVAVLYFQLIFRNVSGFGDDVENTTKQPFLHRDYCPIDTTWSKQKLIIWILLSIGCGVLAYHQLPDWLPRWFSKPA